MLALSGPKNSRVEHAAQPAPDPAMATGGLGRPTATIGILNFDNLDLRSSIRFGESGDPLELEVFGRLPNRNDAPSRLANLSIGDDVLLIWLETTPDLLDFLQHILPVLATAAGLIDRSERFAEESARGRCQR